MKSVKTWMDQRACTLCNIYAGKAGEKNAYQETPPACSQRSETYDSGLGREVGEVSWPGVRSSPSDSGPHRSFQP